MKSDKLRLDELTRELLGFRNADTALLVARYFKTGKGQYGEGNVFLGINVLVLGADFDHDASHEAEREIAEVFRHNTKGKGMVISLTFSPDDMVQFGSVPSVEADGGLASMMELDKVITARKQEP